MENQFAQILINELRTLNKQLAELVAANQRQASKLDDIATQIRFK